MNRIRTMLFGAALLALSMRSFATGMFMLDLQQLSTNAEHIVQAKVTAVVTRWNKDSTAIFTYIRANIIDDLLGPDEDNEIIIKQPGGTMGTLTMTLEGTATYQVGESDVLFLFTDPQNPAAYQTLGLYQGKYRVYTSTDQIERVAQDEVENVTLYKRAKTTETAVTGNNMTLAEFKQLILQYRSGN